MHKSPNQTYVSECVRPFFEYLKFPMDVFAWVFSPGPTHLVRDGRYVAHALNV